MHCMRQSKGAHGYRRRDCKGWLGNKVDFVSLSINGRSVPTTHGALKKDVFKNVKSLKNGASQNSASQNGALKSGSKRGTSESGGKELRAFKPHADTKGED